MSRQSSLEITSDRWLGKKVTYAPGRAGKVYDLSADGKRLLVLRNSIRKRDGEKGIVVVDVDDPNLAIID